MPTPKGNIAADPDASIMTRSGHNFNVPSLIMEDKDSKNKSLIKS